jgi:hypothetical protein
MFFFCSFPSYIDGLHKHPKPVNSSTYDHRTLKTRLPVRSALFKQRTGESVVKWVTISESSLLYAFFMQFLLALRKMNEREERYEKQDIINETKSQPSLTFSSSLSAKSHAYTTKVKHQPIKIK